MGSIAEVSGDRFYPGLGLSVWSEDEAITCVKDEVQQVVWSLGVPMGEVCGGLDDLEAEVQDGAVVDGVFWLGEWFGGAMVREL